MQRSLFLKVKECCRREIAEETGVQVSVGEPYLTMQEFYEEWFFETCSFLCTVFGENERKLTPREQQMGMVPRRLKIDAALSLFSRHQDYAATDEERRGIYLREFSTLKAHIAQK